MLIGAIDALSDENVQNIAQNNCLQGKVTLVGGY